MGPTPYTDVEPISITQYDKDTLAYIANFVKTDCELIRAQIVGIVFGQSTLLKWARIDGDPIGVKLSPGSHTMRVFIYTEGETYDEIDIRVRHDCDGEIVDTTFDRILPEDIG
jgi:hypothetical protein